MSLSTRSKAAALAALVLLGLSSCRYGPAAVQQPGIDASAAGSDAMELYDTNGDGKVAGDELAKAPALKAALARLDTNKDGSVDASEVTARINVWQEMRTARTSVRCHVKLDGQPLQNATVVFEPETFLGDEIKTATGVSNQFGDVYPSIAAEELSDPTLPGGVHFGLYKVRISKVSNGKETIPSRYNTETELGQEVSDDDPAMKNNNMAFALKSK